MNVNFAASLAAVLLHEGGYVDDPQDPGGATNRGVTQAVYDDWRVSQGLPKRAVRLINDYEVGSIYRGSYWNACHCDDLPSGVDYAVFDFAVNSGVHRACRYLQRACGVTEDGALGPMTMQAVTSLNAVHLVDAICDLRIGYLQKLPTFARFGRGWTARVTEVDVKAKAMAS